MCKRNSKILILFSLLLVIGLLLGIMIIDGEDSGECPKCNSVTESKSYSYKDIAGYYTAKDTVTIASETFNVGYHLYLFENGTFYYGYVMNTVQSTIGNYMIVGNEIHLNYLFKGGSDAGLNATTGSKVLTIDGNTITDNNAPSYTKCAKDATDTDTNSTAKCGPVTITLEKDTTTNYNSNDYDVNYLINNYELFNKANTNF